MPVGRFMGLFYAIFIGSSETFGLSLFGIETV